MITPFNPAHSNWKGLSSGTKLEGKGVFLLTGQVGTGPDGEPVTSSIEDQVTAVFENLKATLEAGDLGFEHVGRLTAYITDSDPELLSAYQRIRSQYVNMDAPPASVAVQVVALYDPRLKIEVEAIGVIPG
ncbi:MULTISPECIES: RidA family protein [Ponticoccus]|uniref:RidA family protein n=1 Tax=Ponticoccus litoralis TaxID=422297 RepID=A0AAW9SDW9_9RHOB